MAATLAPMAPRRIPPLRWTVDEFHRVRASGAFDGRRAILLNGVILEQGPMNTPHAVAVDLVADTIRAIAPSGMRIRSQLPLVVGTDSDPFPDAALVSAVNARDFLATHPTSAYLVVEISDTTLDTDVTDKAELYATAGVLDYWVLDLENRELLVFRDPVPLPSGLGATAYRTRIVLGPNDGIAPLAIPNATIRVSDLLP